MKFSSPKGWDKTTWNVPVPGETLSIWLGVGQLPLIPVGSMWQRGICIGESKRQHKSIVVTGAR